MVMFSSRKPHGKSNGHLLEFFGTLLIERVKQNTTYCWITVTTTG